MLLALAVTLAAPEALVTAVEIARFALAPEEGAAKVTVTPLNGFPAPSLTVACSAVAKAVPNGADWGVPPVAVTLAAWLDVFVNEKDAESAPTLAVTV
jgi:hypothetical protein